MRRIHQLVAVARSCFGATSPTTLAGVSAYGAYHAWLAIRGIAMIGDVAYIHLWVALAAAGAWVGACIGRTVQWSGSVFTPELIPALGVVAAFVTVSAAGINSATAFIGGLGPLPLAIFGPLAFASGLTGGHFRPALTMHLLSLLVILVPLGPFIGTVVPLPQQGAAVGTVASVVALVAAAALLFWFACRGLARTPASVPPSSSTWGSWNSMTKLLRCRWCEPALGRISVWSATLAAGCTFAHRHLGLEWRDSSFVVLLGSLCAVLGVTGTSVSLSRGPLLSTAWLLLCGAGNRRDAARRVLWGIVANTFFAAGVFTAVNIALGPDWHLIEMVLVALTACHAYLAAACPSRWLLSHRLSVVIASPTVALVAWAAWTQLPWDLPTALAACVLSGIAAVYLGGIGMARIDLDPVPDTEPTS